ncbi:syntaxin-16 isoform X6 [Tursiops truncatus]|uniref:syntaxin-16 isoform X6 n=1 Tax=Tursiops truncatus TaxID=9739 RepID=UPI003CCF0280
MATRRLTDAFLLLRNNSIQNRQLLAEQVSSHTTCSPLHSRSIAALADDRMALVSGISLDPEAAIGVTKRLPPKWVDGVDEIQYDVGRIKQKMKELASLHDQHLNRPTLDDSLEQEHAIEITTQEITQGFTDDQLALVGQSTLMVDAREREVGRIVQSICDLNEIFRDLGAMIAEQGTVLDRIDYNVEQSCIKTEDGLKQLHKARLAVALAVGSSEADGALGAAPHGAGLSRRVNLSALRFPPVAEWLLVGGQARLGNRRPGQKVGGDGEVGQRRLHVLSRYGPQAVSLLSPSL